MNLDEQDLKEFLCDELFYSLFDVAEDTYAQQFGRYVDDNTYRKAKRNFLYNLSKVDMKPEDYLRAIYSVESIKEQESLANTDRKFSSRSLRRRISSTLSELYCERAGISEEDPNYDSLSMDITNQFASYIRDISIPKGPIEQLKSNTSVHSLFKSFFDSLERAYEYEPISKGQKRRVLKSSKKRLKFSDPSKKLKKLMIPLMGVALAGAMHSVVSNGNQIQTEAEPAPIIETNNTFDLPSDQIVEAQETEVANTSAVAQETETPTNHEQYMEDCNKAIDFLYANPEYFAFLKMPENFVEDFNQYILQKNRVDQGVELSDEEQDQYDELRHRLANELIERKTLNTIYEVFHVDTHDLDFAASNGYRAQIYFSINDENYSWTSMSNLDISFSQDEKNGVYGSYLARAISSQQIYDNKKNSNHLFTENTNVDDLDTAIRNALIYSTCVDCTLSDDEITMTESLNKNRIQTITNLMEKTNERDSAER